MPAHLDIRALGAYAWVFDLVASDVEVREAAVRRHLTLLWRRTEFRPTGTLADPAGAFTEEHTDLTGDELRRLEPYALLWLQWQERFPADWQRVEPRWPWMSSAIYGFVRHGASPAARAALEDLLLDAVCRPRRHLSDGKYHALARHLDSPALRDRLREAAAAPDRAARLHAGYVLWRVEHPRESTTARAWRRWRRTHGVPITRPRPAPELAALPAAAAAAELVGLDTRELAEVFEALEPAPAARIAAAMAAAVMAAAVVDAAVVDAAVVDAAVVDAAAVDAAVMDAAVVDAAVMDAAVMDAAVVDAAAVDAAAVMDAAALDAAATDDASGVAAAIAAMEVRSAAWMFNAMPQPLAARLLAAMPPALAAARFPRPKRDQVLLLMSAGAAAERLSAMPALTASRQLRWRPADIAAGFLAAMDPAAAAAALAAMRDGRELDRILAALPEDVAAGLLARMPPHDRDRVCWTVETERFETACRVAVAAFDTPSG